MEPEYPLQHSSSDRKNHTAVLDKEQSSCEIGTGEPSRQVLCFAETFMKQGDYRSAEPLFRQALHHMQQPSDAACPQEEILEILINIGKCCQSSERLEDAMTSYQQALRLKSGRCIQEESAKIQILMATTLYEIGMIHSKIYLNGVDSNRDQAMKAWHSFQLCLNIRRNCFGSSHPTVASVQHNMGIILFVGGQLEAAIQHFNASLETRQAALGDHHPEVASSLRHLAMVYVKLEKYEESFRLLGDALNILRCIPHEPYLQDVLLELARVKRLLDGAGRAFAMQELNVTLPSNVKPSEKDTTCGLE